MKKLISLVSMRKEKNKNEQEEQVDEENQKRKSKRSSLFLNEPKSPSTPRDGNESDSPDLFIQKKNKRKTIQMLLSPFKSQQKLIKDKKVEKSEVPFKIMVFGAPKCGRTTLIQNFFMKGTQGLVYLTILKINNVKFEKKSTPFIELFYGTSSKKSFINNGAPENQNFLFHLAKDFHNEKVTINSKFLKFFKKFSFG